MDAPRENLYRGMNVAPGLHVPNGTRFTSDGQDLVHEETETGSVLRRADSHGRDDGPVMIGHFARFGEWNEIDSWYEGRFLERINPGAFSKTFDGRLRSVAVTFNHGHDVMGQQVLGIPAVLREDDHGPYYEVPLLDGIPDLIMSGLRADAYGASYMFNVVRDEWEDEPETSDHNPQGLPERTISEVKLHEFGPVTYPADGGATAGVRSLTDHFRTSPEDTPPELAPVDGDAASNDHAPPQQGTRGLSPQDRDAFWRSHELSRSQS